MLDGYVRKQIDPVLERIGEAMADAGISANTVTIFGFAIGVCAGVAIYFGYYWVGLAFLLMSRLADGLDGCVARASQSTDFGGYLDIVLDFAFYGLIPVAFILHNPEQNAYSGALLVLSFYVNGASFLAYATIAEKRGMKTSDRGAKSLYFTTGLAEGTETILIFVALCLFPSLFSWIAYFFAAVCFYTAFSRIVQASAEFR